jgi:ATP-binding cassette, subfamily B, multidrug efflux pump
MKGINMALNTVKQDETTKSAGKWKTLLRLYSYLLYYKKSIIAVLVIMFLCVGISLYNPVIIEKAVNVYIVGNDMHGLVKIGILAAVINTVMVVLIQIRMYIMAKLSNDVLLRIRKQLYEHIQTLSFSFFDSRPTGKILARIIGDVNSLKDVLSNSVTTLIPDFFTLIAVVVIMLIKNYKLALASMCTLPLMIAGVWFVQAKAHKRWQIFRKKSSNLNAFIHEDISGMRVIQSFAAEKETQEEFDDLMKQHRDSFMAAVKYADAFGPVVTVSWTVGVVAMFFTAVVILKMGINETGTIIAFGTYISMFWNPIMNLSNLFNQLTTNISGAERIFDILDTKPDINDGNESGKLPKICGGVEFSHVDFAYDNDADVLHDVSFKVKPGEMIALVGPTGAGKSTIVNLICRFYDTKGGNIYIDGYDIKKVTIESLREQLGIMTQENFLFSGTVRDNIRYGRLNATDEEIEIAAKAVNAHDFIMKMEKGYDTLLKERGAGLSIGQKQLLAFARTMVSNPGILILDEATSSIDTKTELLVQKGIESLLKGRTSFVIAHRLSTISKADRIFFVNNGGIVEQGSHEELMKKKGEYYKLYMAQF